MRYRILSLLGRVAIATSVCFVAESEAQATGSSSGAPESVRRALEPWPSPLVDRSNTSLEQVLVGQGQSSVIAALKYAQAHDPENSSVLRLEYDALRGIVEASGAGRSAKDALAQPVAELKRYLPTMPQNDPARARLLVILGVSELVQDDRAAAEVTFRSAERAPHVGELSRVLLHLRALAETQGGEALRELAGFGDSPAFPLPDFPRIAAWDVARVACDLMKTLRYGAAFNEARSDRLERRVLGQFMAEASKNEDKPASDQFVQAAFLLINSSLNRGDGHDARYWIDYFKRKRQSVSANTDLASELYQEEVKAEVLRGDLPAARHLIDGALGQADRVQPKLTRRWDAIAFLAKDTPAELSKPYLLSALADAEHGADAPLKVHFEIVVAALGVFGREGDLVSLERMYRKGEALSIELDKIPYRARPVHRSRDFLQLAKARALSAIVDRRQEAVSTLEQVLDSLEAIVPLREVREDEVLEMVTLFSQGGDYAAHQEAQVVVDLQLEAFPLLARLYMMQGRWTEAEPLLDRALIISYALKTVSGDIQEQSGLQLDLATIAAARGDPAARRNMLNEAMYQLGVLNRPSPELARGLVLRGREFVRDGDVYPAYAAFARAISILERAPGRGPETLIQALSGQAALRRDADPSGALKLAEMALELMLPRSREESAMVPLASPLMETFASIAAGPLSSAAQVAARDAFQLAQWMTSLSASVSVEALARRLAIRDPAAARQFQAQVELGRRRTGLEAELRRTAFTMEGRDTTSNIDQTQRLLQATDAKLRSEELAFAVKYPRLADVVKINVIPPASIFDRRGVAPDEALVIFVDAGDALYAATAHGGVFGLVRLKLRPDDVALANADLRRGLTLSTAGNHDRLPVFPFETAKRLYRGLVTPIEPLLGGALKLILVTGGVTSGIPFNVLARGGDLSGSPDEPASFATVEWMSDRFTLIWAPSTASLVALRSTVTPSNGERRVVVFADPALGDADRQPFTGPMRLELGGVANVDEVRALPSVPETRIIATYLTRALGGGDNDQYLKKRATEAQLRQLDAAGELQQYRVVAFATHGLVAGELPKLGLHEPALVLTPPEDASADSANDGLLTASEAAELRLDADWVMLLACNTAGGDPRVGSEPLSGLARSFILAGARALLVSQWPADAAATEAFALKLIIPGKPPSYADVNRAGREIRQQLKFGHPAFWGAFVYVGG